jgi:hypothetical protein
VQNKPYPHGFTIRTKLAHLDSCQIQLLLQISSRASRIFQVQLRILKFLRKSCILVSQARFDAFAVYQEILKLVRQSGTIGICGTGERIPLLTHCHYRDALAGHETAARNP